MTKTFKNLWLISGFAGLAAAFNYFSTKEGISLVLIAFIACLVFRMLYIKSMSE